MDVAMDQSVGGPPNHNSNSGNHNNNKTVEYFLVQKCWFDGPLVNPPNDYLAVFSERAKAEEVALQSAHLYAAEHKAVTRTILLPQGYAFSSAGQLFWIRSVQVNVTPDISPYHDHCSTGAHTIFTGGVIGGTGNANSRRGSEASSGVVFVGPDSHNQALHALTHGASSHNNTNNNNRRIRFLPFGPLKNLMDGWIGDENHPNPHYHQQQQLAPQQQQQAMETTTNANESSHNKRSAMQACAVVVNKEALPESSDYRPMKRRCGASSSSQVTQQGGFSEVEQHTPVDAAMRM